ncbi:MAG: HEAT repeat domain-containing protein [Kofleriaceae bacterium]
MRNAMIVAALLLGTAVAHAQPADVPALTKLIESQPGDMDRPTWKEKRRDAARKLGQSKDKKAVPALIKLAETETFDIIGEIAIEGLGNLGDPSAVPALQKIANDAGRDKAQRDLAKKALGKLGTSATAPAPATTAPTPAPTPAPATSNGGAATTTTTSGAGAAVASDPDPAPSSDGDGASAGDGAGAGSSGSALLGQRPGSAVLPELPTLPDDAIAAWERLTFAAGTASLAYDTVRKRTSFDADVSGLYAKRIERERMAWGFDVGANLVAGLINPEGRAMTRGTQIGLDAHGEVRFYAGKTYGIGKAAAGVQLNYLADIAADPANEDLRDTRATADLQIAIGGGYGRLIDVGGAIRVRRLSRTLDAARALGKPIDDATAKRLQLTWWALRGERSSYRALVATVAILREAGILLGEPDAGLTYEILAVLRDTQLFLRPSGFDIQLAFGEGYLRRPGSIMDGSNVAREAGRVEQLLFNAGYGAQLADDKLEISGTSYARMRLFAPDDPMQPSPWAFGAAARMRRFTYGEHGDPFGALDLAADIRIADDDLDPDGEIGARLAAQLGFTYWMNQASGIRLAATAAIDGGELFIGAQLQATYGLLDVTFAGI